MSLDFNNTTLLITGGTGSFGRRFAVEVLNRYRLKKLIIFSRDEAKQFDMQHDGPFQEHLPRMRFFIGDVRDLERLTMALKDVDYVIHAAALKHIATAEYNPFECIRTNVHGAENVVTAAIRTNVKRVVALSTDKAANPINLYGASKLAADKIFVAAANLAGLDGPKFAIVRYGNVVGSRGSVVPLFQRKIEEGAESLPITDPRMTRFWITLQQGVEFVLTTFAMMRGGEIFVPKIPSMRVVRLAKAMAAHLATHTIGFRPGEKLHEELITEEDARSTLELPDRYVIRPPGFDKKYTGYHLDERPLAEGTRYVSNKNADWLTEAKMRVMLAEVGVNVATPRRKAAE